MAAGDYELLATAGANGALRPGAVDGEYSERYAAELRRSFSSAVAEWTPDLGVVAYLLVGDSESADDLVADAFLAAWQRWPQVLACDNPKAYVRRIVANMAASRVRRLTRQRKKSSLLGSGLTETARLPDVAGGIDLRRALESLPKRQRECVVLRYGADLPEAEVAEILGISVGTVKNSASKGAAALRRQLTDEASA
jgi:RNA polymerase sigma-70 factor (sigma-E family)